MFPEKLHMTISLHKKGVFAKFPSRSFFCYLAREFFLPREGDHFCYFCVFGKINEIDIEILLHRLLLSLTRRFPFTSLVLGTVCVCGKWYGACFS